MGASTDQAVPEAQGKRFTILVVEDETLVRLVAADILRDSGYKVVEASTATEAMMVLASDIDIHLVFADVLLPGSMGGLTLAGWLDTNRPNIPVILTSGVEGVRRYLEGRTGLVFLEKPYSAEDLLHAVSRLLTEPEGE